MFVLERSPDRVKTEEIKHATTVSIRPITKVINTKFLDRLTIQANAISSINEIYQFEIIRNEEEILMLGFSLSVYSDNSRKACINAIQNSILEESFHLPLEIVFLDNQNWHNAVKNIPNGLIWSRSKGN